MFHQITHRCLKLWILTRWGPGEPELALIGIRWISLLLKIGLGTMGLLIKAWTLIEIEKSHLSRTLLEEQNSTAPTTKSGSTWMRKSPTTTSPQTPGPNLATRASPRPFSQVLRTASFQPRLRTGTLDTQSAVFRPTWWIFRIKTSITLLLIGRESLRIGRDTSIDLLEILPKKDLAKTSNLQKLRGLSMI